MKGWQGCQSFIRSFSLCSRPCQVLGWTLRLPHISVVPSQTATSPSDYYEVHTIDPPHPPPASQGPLLLDCFPLSRPHVLSLRPSACPFSASPEGPPRRPCMPVPTSKGWQAAGPGCSLGLGCLEVELLRHALHLHPITSIT